MFLYVCDSVYIVNFEKKYKKWLRVFINLRFNLCRYVRFKWVITDKGGYETRGKNKIILLVESRITPITFEILNSLCVPYFVTSVYLCGNSVQKAANLEPKALL